MTNYRQSLTEAYKKVQERELTPKELKRREEIAKDLPDADFKKRYGDEWKSVKMATATKMAKKEQVNEDGHVDVASAIRSCKTIIEDANDIMNQLNTKNKEDSLPTWWSNKMAVSSTMMNKLRDYITNPIEEKTEADHLLGKMIYPEGSVEDLKKIVEELQNASKMHLGQSKRIDEHIKMMEKGE